MLASTIERPWQERELDSSVTSLLNVGPDAGRPGELAWTTVLEAHRKSPGDQAEQMRKNMDNPETVKRMQEWNLFLETIVGLLKNNDSTI